MKITTLIEDTKINDNSLLTEHGLSFYIEIEERNILFDTGQSNKFLSNAKKLNKDLKKIDCVLLSHGHYDHTGGFKDFIGYAGNSFDMYINPLVFREKYKTVENEYKFIGNDFDKQFLIDNNIKVNYVDKDIEKIFEGVYTVTNFKKRVDFEEINDSLLLFDEEEQKYIGDDFKDEISLVIETSKGLVVVVGCSHIGVVNIIENIKERFDKSIYAVIGGTHLVGASDERIDKTIEYFINNDIKMLGLCHCTGVKAKDIIKDKLNEKYIELISGSEIII